MSTPKAGLRPARPPRGSRKVAEPHFLETGRVIAIVGAESTGKTTLAAALAQRVTEATGLSCALVGEHLREWCDQQGRTPLAHEQLAIAHEQQRRIDAAAATHSIVVADTTALMTAVYSHLLFNDPSLVPLAVAAHRRTALTLLTALDLPWVPDGLQRDGPQVRQPVDQALRALLVEHRLSWSVVGGQGNARLEQAFDAASRLLAALAPAGERSSGLFSRLRARDAAMPQWQWVCEKCDVPDCEHAALQSLQRG